MGLLNHRTHADQRTHDDLVQAVAALNDQEWSDLVDEARQESLIPLAHLVIEGLSVDIGTLAQRLGTEVTVDDIGRRCVTRATATRLFTERSERQEREAAQRRADYLAARSRPHPTRERIRRIKESQDRDGYRGLLREDDD